MECDAWVLGLRLHGVSMCLHEPGLEILLEGARFQPKDEKWLGSARARSDRRAPTCRACHLSKQTYLQLGLPFFGEKRDELDNVSNFSCQPLRAPPRLPAKGGRILRERSRGPDYCVKWALLDPS